MKLLSKKRQQEQSVPRRRLGNVSQPSAEASSASPYAFRRNRTMTGSLVSDFGSATEQTSQLKSKRVQAHELRKHRRKLGWILALVGVGLVSVIFLMNELIVTPRVVVDGDDVVSQENATLYAEGIDQYLVHNPHARLRFLLDARHLAAFMQDHDMPEIERIDSEIKYTDIGTKEFRVTLRQPAVVWQTDKASMYVDAKGTAFGRNAYKRPQVAVVDESGIQAKDNQVLASGRFLGFIGLIVGAMREYGYEVEQVALPAGTTRQVQIRVKTVPYPIKLSVDRGAGEQAEDAIRAAKHLAGQQITPLYLDVRVEGKAFYR